MFHYIHTLSITLGVTREVTYLQVGNIGHISEVWVSHYRIPVCEGFGLVNIMAEWCVQHLVLAFQCVKRSKSVVEVERAFRRGFGNDRGRGPVLTRNTVPSCASQ